MKTFKQFLKEESILSSNDIGKKIKKVFGHETEFTAGECSIFAVNLFDVLENKKYNPKFVIAYATVDFIKKKKSYPMHIAIQLDNGFLDSTGYYSSEESFLSKLNIDDHIKYVSLEIIDTYSELKVFLDDFNDTRVKKYFKEYNYRIYSDLIQEITEALDK